jgi:hypothetical protein
MGKYLEIKEFLFSYGIRNYHNNKSNISLGNRISLYD